MQKPAEQGSLCNSLQASFVWATVYCHNKMRNKLDGKIRPLQVLEVFRFGKVEEKVQNCKLEQESGPQSSRGWLKHVKTGFMDVLRRLNQ
jgi:hypothetical protein